jgi:MFS family permease
MPTEFLARLARKPQFAALRHRDFRLLWAATLLSSTARWADLVVVGWLTLELTESALMVGIVAAAKMVGYLAAPFMGVVVDRMDRRLLLLIAAGGNLVASVAMLLLFVTGWLELWHVIALALIAGLTWALDNPTRNALVPDLVGSENLTNAIALNALALEITVVVGPALGGILIPGLGMGGAYGLIAGILLVDIVVLLLMKKDERHGIAHARESPVKSLVSGLQYVWGNQTVLMLLAVAFLLNMLAAPYRYAFLPLFARYVLDAGPAGYGMLTAMAGFGALAAGIWVVSLGNFGRKGRMLVWSGFAWPVSLALLAVSKWYTVSLVLVFVAGLAQAMVWTVIATLILSNTAQLMRGRVMGLRTGVVISLPLGNFLAGALAESVGAPIAQGVYAASAILVMLAIVLLVPNVRKLD